VNDWFWTRVPQVESPAAFVATLGIGFEGGNLDHATRFTARLLEAGDAESAAVQERVGEEEIPHVRFAIYWYRELAGPLEFDAWRACLPKPLTPTVMRGVPLDAEARRLAGFDDEFLARLAAWSPGS
jgi:uncharacterized ferritin-like protein (DUF455 family)